jgi:hypothetical protein
MTLTTLIGKTFGKWKVVGWDKRRGKWTAICECGRWGKHSRTTLEREESTQCMFCYSHRRPANESAFNAVWNDYVQAARRRKLVWNLTKGEARNLFSSACTYCAQLPYAVKTIPKGQGSFTFNGIDRRDNLQGYILTNCVACCRVCNIMKQDMSVENFLLHVRKIATQ